MNRKGKALKGKNEREQQRREDEKGEIMEIIRTVSTLNFILNTELSLTGIRCK